MSELKYLREEWQFIVEGFAKSMSVPAQNPRSAVLSTASLEAWTEYLLQRRQFRRATEACLDIGTTRE